MGSYESHETLVESFRHRFNRGTTDQSTSGHSLHHTFGGCTFSSEDNRTTDELFKDCTRGLVEGTDLKLRFQHTNFGDFFVLTELDKLVFPKGPGADDY